MTEGDGAGATAGGPPVEGASARTCLSEARAALGRADADTALRWARAVVHADADLPTWLATARLLPAVLGAASVPLRPARVAVVGTSTTAQLVQCLPLAGAAAGLALEVWEAPFAQVEQQVLDPDSELYAFRPDVVVLAVHEGDVDLPEGCPDPVEAVEREAGRWRSLWRELLDRSGAQVLQFTFVLPDARPLGHAAARWPRSRYRMLLELNLRLAEAAPSGVAFLDCDRLAAAVGKDTWADPKYWHLARQSVSLSAVPELARQAAGVLAAQLGTSRKCVVVDLDGTLWGGVLGEVGLDGISLGEDPAGSAFAAFQEHLLQLRRRGVLLAVCSKNDEDLVTEVFERHPGMRLRTSDLAALSAGWNDKPAQLRDLARVLDIGLDALVFVDDNPVEREAVRRLVPEVDVLPLPTDPAQYVRALADYPFLETTSVTEEDGDRTAQYRARAQAKQLLEDAPSLSDYLRSLDMVATVVDVDDATLPRVAQLVGKTNQFNVTGRRRGPGALQDLLDDDRYELLAVRLRDRFADHGLVAVLIAAQDGPVLDVDTWLMSCRVIGRTLEHEMLDLLCERARRRGCRSLRGTFVPSAKNGLVADLFDRLGFVPEPGTPGRWRLELDRAVPERTRLMQVVPSTTVDSHGGVA